MRFVGSALALLAFASVTGQHCDVRASQRFTNIRSDSI
jgi:hypothetical protein